MAKLQRLPHTTPQPPRSPHIGADPRICVLRPHIADDEGPLVYELPGCVRPDLRPRDRDYQSDS